MRALRVPGSRCRLDDFLAASEALVRANGIEYGIAALPNDRAPDNADSIAMPREAVGGLNPAQLLSWDEDPEEGEEWDPAYYTNLFVPFTAFPWDDSTHFIDEGETDWTGERVLSVRPGDVSMAKRDWPMGGYRAIRCADGDTWDLDEENARKVDDPPHWSGFPNPCQLGYIVDRDDQSLVFSPGALVTELDVQYNDAADDSVLCCYSAFFVALDPEHLGELHDRFWTHLRGFLVV